ncbi:unnamed protein product [Caenorhabditis auriculariae]|uniref:Uncharacterized protein n=1 Tax=Caenorhabditis auriculariae TaxID=2777116 RepID=A0A8S1H9I2_9PELO|nr:unnamed protein product [Caenorhabditis auriculariae]
MDRSSGLVLVSSTRWANSLLTEVYKPLKFQLDPRARARVVPYSVREQGGSNETHQLMAITQAGVWEVEAHRILYDVPNSVEAMTICKFKPTPRSSGPPGHSEKYREHHGFL